MEIRIVIVSLACLSCLVPPALSTGLLAKAAILGVKAPVVKAVAIGAGTGLVAKGGMALLAKHPLLSFLLKTVALKGTALLALNKLAFNGRAAKELDLALAEHGLDSKETKTPSTDCPEGVDRTATTTKSPLRDVMSGSARIIQSLLRLREGYRQKSRGLFRAIGMVPKLLDPTVEE